MFELIKVLIRIPKCPEIAQIVVFFVVCKKDGTTSEDVSVKCAVGDLLHNLYANHPD